MIKSYCNSALKSRVRCAARVRHTEGEAENGYPFAYISDRFLEILGWERAEFAARFDNRYTPLLLQCLLDVQGELKQEILQW